MSKIEPHDRNPDPDAEASNVVYMNRGPRSRQRV
ncbi:hypothetical protein SAMN02744786_3387 [Stenotrophomonas sp. CC120222-04]|nr:hypothetical protein SAMN02744786_3387 [Stenotrophomonas sp. CC120222-04]